MPSIPQDLPPHVLSGSIASAGSKVMLTGGYLVLHKPNNGVILGVNARLHTGIYALPNLPCTLNNTTINSTQTDSVYTFPVVVLTPQLRTQPLLLQINIQTPKSNDSSAHSSWINTIEISGDYYQNSFVSKTLLYSLLAISKFTSQTEAMAILSKGILIDIRGDRAFYSSQPVSNQLTTPGITIPPTTTDSQSITTEPIIEEHPRDYTTKTGLGSSAAVVSSLVSSLFAHFNLLPLTSQQPAQNGTSPPEIKTYAYRVAQIAHCIAQGKVGSGFDVATAFFGTQSYCRFSPSLLKPLMDSPLESTAPQYRIVNGDKENTQKANPYAQIDGICTFLDILLHPWDDTVAPFSLPPHLNIVLADVQGGSETPGMVKKVEEWKTKGGDAAKQLWDSLSAANRTIERHFQRLTELATQFPLQWKAVLQLCAKSPNSKWPQLLTPLPSSPDHHNTILTELIATVRDFDLVREKLRQMGQECDVPIEPPSQTKLIDLTCAQNGVLFGGVPGAGGYDAVFAVCIEVPRGDIQTNTEMPLQEDLVKTGILNAWKSFHFEAEQSNNAVVAEIGSTPQGQIFQLPVTIDSVNGVQIRQAYKDFSTLFQ